TEPLFVIARQLGGKNRFSISEEFSSPTLSYFKISSLLLNCVIPLFKALAPKKGTLPFFRCWWFFIVISTLNIKIFVYEKFLMLFILNFNQKTHLFLD